MYDKFFLVEKKWKIVMKMIKKFFQDFFFFSNEKIQKKKTESLTD